MSELAAGALSGLRVIDFGQYIAGPLVAQWLADFGADVIRVDPPGGPMWSHESNALLQRGKRSIVLDLKTPADVEIARRLIDSADVVIENFRPGVMDRLGLGYDDAKDRNPGLIYCSIPGFGSDDPRATTYANEGVVAAAAGLYPAHDFNPDGEPVVNTLPLASVSGALVAANSVAAALVARVRGARGQRVEVSLFDASYELTRLYIDKPPGETSHPRQMGGSKPYAIARSYECQDGRYVRITWLEGRQTEDFAELVGTYDKWDSMGLLGMSTADILSDPARAGKLGEEIAAVFLTQPADYWEKKVAAIADLSVIRSAQEWLLYDEQAVALASTIVRMDPELGLTHQGGTAVTLTETPADPGARHALDADRENILAELDDAPAAVEAVAPFVELTTALEGIRVVDMTVLLAGPTAARLLGEYGAEVVHIGNPNWKGMTKFHFQVHGGKRTMLLDLKKPGAEEVFRQLAENADVISTNFSQSVAKRLGVDEAAIRAYNSGVIYSRISAHGVVGPRTEYRGHEEIGQAATGALMRFSNTPEGNMQFFVINDDGTGHVAAFGILVALYHRFRTGVGQFVGTSLAQTCVTWQTPYMVAHKDRNWNDPGGLDFRGYGPLERVYRGSDGNWFFLAVKPGTGLAALAAVAGLEGVDQVDSSVLQNELAARFARRAAHEWVSALNTSPSIGAGIQATMADVAADPWALDHGLVQVLDFPDAGTGTIVGPAPRLSATPMKIGAPVGPPGRDTRAVLEDLGFADRVDELLASGVAKETRPVAAVTW